MMDLTHLEGEVKRQDTYYLSQFLGEELLIDL